MRSVMSCVWPSLNADSMLLPVLDVAPAASPSPLSLPAGCMAVVLLLPTAAPNLARANEPLPSPASVTLGRATFILRGPREPITLAAYVMTPACQGARRVYLVTTLIRLRHCKQHRRRMPPQTSETHPALRAVAAAARPPCCHRGWPRHHCHPWGHPWRARPRRRPLPVLLPPGTPPTLRAGCCRP
jgi:hypothetical protein